MSLDRSRIKQLVDANVEDLKDHMVWKGVLAEVVGTLILVFVGCAVCLADWQVSTTTTTATAVQISLCFGLAVATAVWCIAHVSGGHINPAITAAMLATRKITVAKAFIYVAGQCVGAIVASALLSVLHPIKGSTLGNTEIQYPLSVGQALGWELIITFILSMTVFASCDMGRSDLNGSAPLTIGLSVTACHLFAIKYTGASMNPARSLGPAVMTGRWRHHYVYWIGPLIGSVLAAFLYEYVFADDASFHKFKGQMLPCSKTVFISQTPPNMASRRSTMDCNNLIEVTTPPIEIKKKTPLDVKFWKAKRLEVKCQSEGSLQSAVERCMEQEHLDAVRKEAMRQDPRSSMIRIR